MTKNIKDLARQAGLIAPHGSDREGLRDFDWREFAKLILKEVNEVALRGEEFTDARSNVNNLFEKE